MSTLRRLFVPDDGFEKSKEAPFYPSLSRKFRFYCFFNAKSVFFFEKLTKITNFDAATSKFSKNLNILRKILDFFRKNMVLGIKSSMNSKRSYCQFSKKLIAF